MKYIYDPMADAINIIFKKGRVAETKEIAEGVLLDVDSRGRPLYLEILDVRKRFDKESLGNLRLRPFVYSAMGTKGGVLAKK